MAPCSTSGRLFLSQVAVPGGSCPLGGRGMRWGKLVLGTGGEATEPAEPVKDDSCSNSGNMGCRRGTGSSPMMQPIPRLFSSSPCGCQDQAWVPPTFIPFHGTCWSHHREEGTFAHLLPSAQPMLSSKRRSVWGGGVGQSYATCPGHREVRFLNPKPLVRGSQPHLP